MDRIPRKNRIDLPCNGGADQSKEKDSLSASFKKHAVKKVDNASCPLYENSVSESNTKTTNKHRGIKTTHVETSKKDDFENEQLLKERQISNSAKQLPCYKELAKGYLKNLFSLYCHMYDEKFGTVKFIGDSLSTKEVSLSSDNGCVVTPDYTATSDVGWNAMAIKNVMSNGTPEECISISLKIIMSEGFKSILVKLITNPNTPENQQIIQEFFSKEEFEELSDRYHQSPETFATFKWVGWNALRNESREFKPDEHLPDHDLLELYNQGKITKKELAFQLTNPNYGVNLELDGRGSYDVDQAIALIDKLPAKRDIGKDRMRIVENTVFSKAMAKTKSRAVAGPSGTSFRLLYVGKLLSPALQKTMKNISKDQLNKSMVAQCLGYLTPDDHSVKEVEMAAQDVGIFTKEDSAEQILNDLRR